MTIRRFWSSGFGTASIDTHGVTTLPRRKRRKSQSGARWDRRPGLRFEQLEQRRLLAISDLLQTMQGAATTVGNFGDSIHAAHLSTNLPLMQQNAGDLSQLTSTFTHLRNQLQTIVPTDNTEGALESRLGSGFDVTTLSASEIRVAYSRDLISVLATSATDVTDFGGGVSQYLSSLDFTAGIQANTTVGAGAKFQIVFGADATGFYVEEGDLFASADLSVTLGFTGSVRVGAVEFDATVVANGSLQLNDLNVVLDGGVDARLRGAEIAPANTSLTLGGGSQATFDATQLTLQVLGVPLVQWDPLITWPLQADGSYGAVTVDYGSPALLNTGTAAVKSELLKSFSSNLLDLDKLGVNLGPLADVTQLGAGLQQVISFVSMLTGEGWNDSGLDPQAAFDDSKNTGAFTFANAAELLQIAQGQAGVDLVRYDTPPVNFFQVQASPSITFPPISILEIVRLTFGAGVNFSITGDYQIGAGIDTNGVFFDTNQTQVSLAGTFGGQITLDVHVAGIEAADGSIGPQFTTTAQLGLDDTVNGTPADGKVYAHELAGAFDQSAGLTPDALGDWLADTLVLDVAFNGQIVLFFGVNSPLGGLIRSLPEPASSILANSGLVSAVGKVQEFLTKATQEICEEVEEWGFLGDVVGYVLSCENVTKVASIAFGDYLTIIDELADRAGVDLRQRVLSGQRGEYTWYFPITATTQSFQGDALRQGTLDENNYPNKSAPGDQIAFEVVNGELRITGTDQDDTIHITDLGGGNVQLMRSTIVAGSPHSDPFRALAGVTSVKAELKGGADYLLLSEASTLDVQATGGPGNDEIRAGAGDDTVLGGDGNDRLVGAGGGDALDGEAGDDILEGGDGNDQLNGGDGEDVITGDAGGDSLDGGGGNDRLFGMAGDDLLSGGEGHDTILGGDGDDNLDGEAGDDTLLGGRGDDVIVGGDGEDALAGQEDDDDLQAGSGDDMLTGGTGVDELRGEDGDDDLLGGQGKDLLIGGAGDDVASGGLDDDLILVGLGNDLVDGGSPSASDTLFVDAPLAKQFSVLNQSRRPDEGVVFIYDTGVIASENSFVDMEVVTGSFAGGPFALQFLVLQADFQEANDEAVNATDLGFNSELDLADVSIVPRRHPFNVAVPADEDWYRWLAPRAGAMQFSAIYREFAANQLPDGGQLKLEIYSAAGQLLVTSTKSPDGERVAQRATISVQEGSAYFVRVVGTSSDTINAYDLRAQVVDSLGPRVTDLFPTDFPTFDLFANQLGLKGPTPPLTQLTLALSDELPRVAGDLYPALAAAPALHKGHYVLRGDHTGFIAIDQVTLVNAQPVVGQPATALVTLSFVQPLPDDRFTLTVFDALTDPAGNPLDGESNAVTPEAVEFPSGDGLAGGDFVARFTVDSRPEVGVTASTRVYVDINGTFQYDPAGNGDATNRDLIFQFGTVSDAYFAGDFSPAGAATSSGYDKLGAFGWDPYSRTYRFLLDFNHNGVADFASVTNVPGSTLPVAGDFSPQHPGDEIGLFSGNTWYLDSNGDNQLDMYVDTVVPTVMRGIPAVGDVNGDGLDDLLTFDAARDSITIDLNRDGLPDDTIAFGIPDYVERLVVGDLNLDGVDDLGLWVAGSPDMIGEGKAEWYFLISDRVPLHQPGSVTLASLLFDAFSPNPLGNDIFANYGDRYALPVFGNFDPPLVASDGYEPAGHRLSATNPINAWDVNADGHVSPLDALLVINRLNATGTTSLPDIMIEYEAAAPFLDVSGDRVVSPLDALWVINRLNQNRDGAGEGEGEGESPSDGFAELYRGPSAGTQPLTAVAGSRSKMDRRIRAVNTVLPGSSERTATSDWSDDSSRYGQPDMLKLTARSTVEGNADLAELDETLALIADDVLRARQF